MHERFGLVPLSVAADRIARPAMRAAGLLARLGAEGRPVARAGMGVVVEVYPTASLRQWKLRHRGYKGAARRPERLALVAELVHAATWLDLGGHREFIERSDHALDAVIAALTARAAALGLTRPPTATEAEIAAREGWIAVPTCELSALSAQRSDPVR